MQVSVDLHAWADRAEPPLKVKRRAEMHVC